MRPFFWYLALLTATVIAFGVGFVFVSILRNKCKSNRNIRYFTTTVFLTPIGVYLFFSLLVLVGVCNRTVSDAIAFGTVFGILLQLAMKPQGSGSIKLVAKQVDGKHADVWLDSLDVTVGEVRNKIAESLNITPSARVSIESGKGTFMEDLSQPFLENIDDTLKKTDFFGYLTACCYVYVKEEEKKKVIVPKEEDDVNDRSDKKTFLGILQKPEVKYGEFLVCSAKIGGSTDAKVNFQISFVDRFVAGAPATLQLNSTTIRIHPWADKDEKGNPIQNGNTTPNQKEEPGHPDNNNERNNSTDAFSDTGESTTSTHNSNGNKRGMKRGSIFFRPKNDEMVTYFGKPVHHGDIVVLETSGKYMSVTRGWWMAWNSNIPRRSGAFKIEIIEKAQNQLKELKEQFKNIKENIKEKIGRGDQDRKIEKEKEFDNVLRPGDLFRLRSVKFPDFELGLTSVKIRDEYCYLGLRKIGSTEVSEDDAWCMEVKFTFRNANDILNLIANK